jgi:hypothetical protein
MKWRSIVLVAFLAGSVNVLAQNLVPNGGFEDVLNCPDALKNINDDCSNWYGSIQLEDPDELEPSPDFYHGCGTEGMIPPNVSLGYQETLDGQGMVGFIPYTTIESEFSEILGVELIEPLSIGSYYNIQFSIVSDSNVVNNIGINKLGFKFTTYPVFNSMVSAINNFAHGSIDEIVIDTISWQTFDFGFQADSAYTTIHFGRFFSDDQIDTVHYGQTPVFYAYYFIDGVSITEVLSTRNQNKFDIKIYPNPAQDRFTIQAPEGIVEYTIYNLSGDLLKSEKGYGKASIESNIVHLPAGVYVLHLTTQTQSYYERVVKL